jgi:hypothetical protein
MEMSNLEGIGDKKIQIFLNAYIIELPRLSMHLKEQEFPWRNLAENSAEFVNKLANSGKRQIACYLFRRYYKSG